MFSLILAKTIMWYNVASRNWKKLAELPEPRIHHAACLLNGKVYISGTPTPYIHQGFLFPLKY